jgi:hypothetical protein
VGRAPGDAGDVVGAGHDVVPERRPEAPDVGLVVEHGAAAVGLVRDMSGPYRGEYEAGGVWAVLDLHGTVSVNGRTIAVEHPGCYELIAATTVNRRSRHNRSRNPDHFRRIRPLWWIRASLLALPSAPLCGRGAGVESAEPRYGLALALALAGRNVVAPERSGFIPGATGGAAS